MSNNTPTAEAYRNTQVDFQKSLDQLRMQTSTVIRARMTFQETRSGEDRDALRAEVQKLRALNDKAIALREARDNAWRTLQTQRVLFPVEQETGA